ncbi:MAG: DUF2752 domain-containing protein [Chitinophagales bacterium]
MKSFLQQNRNPLLLLSMMTGYGFLFMQPGPVFGEEHSTWCLFHLLTGLPCPTCGTGRGIICLLHGNFQDALLFNPLSFVVVVLSLLFALLLLKDSLQKTNSLNRLMKLSIPLAYQIPLWLLLIANEIWNIHKGL